MLSLGKHADDTAAVSPRWHQNFRNFEKLPDTKVVRTAFFIHTVAICAAVLMLLWVCYREYNISSLKRQIADHEQMIQASNSQNIRNLALSTSFKALDAKVAEVVAFVTQPVAASDLIGALANSLPEDMSLIAITYNTQDGARIRGVVTGLPEEAAGVVSAYIDVLKKDAYLGDKFKQVVLISLSPAGDSGMLSYEVGLFHEAGRKR